MNNRSIVIRKSGGFYQVFDNDALIISYLFDYKIINHKCGFPLVAINKVINTLEEKKINFIIKDEEEVVKNFRNKNTYSKYLEKARVKDNINNRIKSILDKINDLDVKKLNEVLSVIEETLYE